MPVVTVVHIVFDNSNDPGRVARRHVAREIGKGMKQIEIVTNAWQRRQAPVPNHHECRAQCRGAPGCDSTSG
jgi:hypothetical protein